MSEEGKGEKGRDEGLVDLSADDGSEGASDGFASSEARLRVLFELAPDAYYLNDLQGRFVDGNRAAEELCGFPKAELVGKSFLKLKLLRFADVPRAASHLARNALGLSGGPDELTIVRKDGMHIPVEVRTYPVNIEGQKLVLGIARDVTERKRAEDDLRAARDDLADRVEARTGELRDALSRVEDEVRERRALEETLRAQREAFKVIADSSLRGVSLQAFCELVIHRLLAATHFDFGSVRLFDDEKKELVLVATAGLSAGSMARVEGAISLAAEDWSAAIIARRRETIAAPNVAKSGILQPARSPLQRLGVGALLAGPLAARDGTLLGVLQLARHRRTSTIPSMDQSFFASIAEVLATAVERDRIHAALAESRARHEAVISQAEECIFLVDVETLKILEANPAMQRFLGYTEAELVKKDLYDIVAHAPGDINQRVLEILESGRTFLGERQYRRKDGTAVPVEVSASVVSLAGRRALAVVTRDLTERHALEAQLRHSQKMEAVGRLAGGVAHDFNNMLTAMSGFAELIRMRAEGNEAVERHADAIVRASDRASSLTRQLLAFSRRQVLDQRVASLNSILEELEEMLRRLLRHDVTLVTDFDPEQLPVKVDAGQIDQVVLNLALNAQDAMPEGGTVTIILSQISAGNAEDDLVRLSVSDTGTGMEAAIAEKVFEPFFTTKPQGEGTGLGLAVVYGIVNQHHGKLHVESAPGEGTTVHVDLPSYLLDEPSSEVAPTPTLLRGKGEQVLVVEDDDEVRAFACEALRESGYQAVEASDAPSAMEIVDAEEPDLLFTDIGLPGQSGVALAADLRLRLPALPVILTSGRGAGQGSPDVERTRGLPFLQKPYNVEELLAAIKMCLRSSGKQ